MGCATSKDGCLGENRPKELGRCAAVSSDVRWSWLRGRTMFAFSELRSLLKLYQAAVNGGTSDTQEEGTPVEDGLERSHVDDTCVTSSNTATGALAPSVTVKDMRGYSVSSLLSKASTDNLGMMNKEQFLTACHADEAFRLPEVVGGFGPRLFDVLDENGDGKLSFEEFALGMSRLLKGPESEKLKLMFSAYDLSGVKSSEERAASAAAVGFGGMKAKTSRRGKYLTVEDITAVLATISIGAYPTLLQFSAGDRALDGFSGSGVQNAHVDDNGKYISGQFEPRGDSIFAQGKKKGLYSESKKCGSSDDDDGRGCGSGERGALEEALRELARRNAADYAARAVSEFGQAQDGVLTQKEFERWALTGPVLRCRIHEFSLDVNVVPFQGLRLA